MKRITLLLLASMIVFSQPNALGGLLLLLVLWALWHIARGVWFVLAGR